MFKVAFNALADRALCTCRRLAACNKGIAALEFGYVVPIMLMMFLGTVELSQAITVDRRVSHVASSTADLVARQKNVTQTTLDTYMQIIDQLMSPYEDDLLKLTIVHVYATAANPTQPKVCWSYNRNDNGTARGVTTYTKDQNYTGLPENLVTGGSSVVVVEVQYDYQPLILQYFIQSTMPMKEKFYLKPRLSASVQYGTDPACV
jgi:Flp pilus assembly protein TadG